ncbi:P-loop containing nucleoside triphosphate hydrolase protein [Aspergillus candidus]|uniref:P-loop containing nucleoside triphosphate hydrolase protein n=1 Tax=Aspergillus candidus TaxID=41067 RepID=A0A2I2F7J5_ASPCN|nr:P-loop containing nucleoside triphosphate hydrolase protein [Aspergillus candidus]PLB36595.1 P-loop containing nucleoside triphosphate hydrolase protein [Aspergillus candidus]
MEIRSRDDTFVHNVPYSKPFDLSVSQQAVDLQHVIYNITTVLETSLAAYDCILSEDEIESLEQGIVNIASIDVSLRSTRVTICSESLLKVIARVVTYYPSAKLGGKVLQLDEPYPLIAHYFDDFEAYRATYREPDVDPLCPLVAKDSPTQPPCDEEEFNHLGSFLDFFKTSGYMAQVNDEKARHTQNLCTFRMLWLLFKPGETVYMVSEGQMSAYVIQSVEVDRKVLSSRVFTKPYSVYLWNLQYDGRFVGRSSEFVYVSPFDGERQITSLKIFPSHFYDRTDGEKTREHLIRQGQQWYESLQGRQMIYSGEFLGSSKRRFQGRVYMDLSSYFTQENAEVPQTCDVADMGEDLGNCVCDTCLGLRPHPPPGFRWADYDLLDPSVTVNLELPGSREGARHRYLLCSRLLYGFVFKSRKWAEKLNISCCHEPEVNKRAIDSLVMPEARKEMIRALVHKYTEPSGDNRTKLWGADFIESKGEGQIFLLHGSPGVGKTFVKCIAEYTGRALLSLTCGDIGTDELELENQLSKWFRLAEKWGAIMLIDEADVYLEKRQITDLKRNSLVSVFLRCIEYYRGILFLTTNRVGHFDDAFISRIHVVIRYEKLKEDDRRKIWEQFFDKLTDERQDFIITRRAKQYVLEDEVISKIEWNGREIRNVFQTAVTLAEFRFSQKPDKTKGDGPTLDQKDFEQVCNMTREFKQYLIGVHGVDEESRAFQARARANNIRDIGR